jgi:pyridinium-3,5-biscarboxylic acid mononucleotide synthase
MQPEHLRSILQAVAAGSRSVDSALEDLRDLPYEDLGFARLDHHRSLRTGVPEVIFGQGKTPAQIVSIIDRFVARSGRAIVTRISAEAVALVQANYPQARYAEAARMLTVGDFPIPPAAPFVAVLAAGTSDLPVAEEAALTLELLGTQPTRLYDVGVAGLHRLLDKISLLRQATAIVAVAGMEGALATVVGGLVACPVVAVPTSVGYGASFHGLAALLTMLNSCVPGVAVVNIDNGFGAGAFAHMIARQAAAPGLPATAPTGEAQL